MLPVGHIVQDRYRVEDRLGSGGLAEVYKVRHLTLGSLHALKVLSWDRPSIDRRLLLEGRIQAQLRHPNIVAVTDVLEVYGKTALLLDYIDGPTLDVYVGELDGPLAVEPALDLFADILAAVVRAHDAGVLHRDLKPQNVLLASEGGRMMAKVTDFGLAKVVVEELAASSTRADVTMGTPGYMPPEQVRDAASVDARTDVFALGVLLYEMLTGTRAFADEDGITHLTATLEDEPPDLPATFPQHLQDAVSTALRRDPEERPGNAREMAESIFPEGDPRRRQVLAMGGTPLAFAPRQESVATLTPAHATYLVEEQAPNDVSVPSAEGSALTVVPPEPKAPWLAIGVGVVLTAGIGVVLGWLFLGPGKPSEPPQPVPVAAPAEPVPAPKPAPAPPVPEPEPTAEAAPAPAVAPVVAPEPAPQPAPSALPQPAPAEPAAVPEPEAPPPAPEPPAPVPEVQPEPEPVPVPVAQPEPSGGDEDAEEEMRAMRNQWVGTWSGTATGGRPIVLRIDRVDADGVRGELVFTGPSARTFALVGTYGKDSLRMSSADGTQVQAKLAGGRSAGRMGRASVRWRSRRAGRATRRCRRCRLRYRSSRCPGWRCRLLCRPSRPSRPSAVAKGLRRPGERPPH